ncbi:MFS general substrate transporter [Dentipellis sp. KUC8613]|nr:MFS general substrate transporter [Dentipellis sp. KUC8613]
MDKSEKQERVSVEEHKRDPDEKSRAPSVKDVENAELLGEQRAEAEKKLVRKLDTRLMPTIIIIFIMNFVDRGAVAAARLTGMEEDLHLTDIQYNAILAVLYATYCPFQAPSNMLLNYITRPAWYISGCLIIWGLVSTLTGATHNFAGMLACRIFIGIPEAVFYPGAVYLLSRWYTRKELGFRSVILYGGPLISNAIGGLMAAGILGTMEGKRGIRAWRWLFYIEGCITIFLGVLAIWLLPDYPHNTRWMTPAERRLAQVRLAEDAGEADEDTAGESPWYGFVLAIKDPKTILFALMSCSQLLGLSFVTFFPTLTSTLGFGSTISLLLQAPPWVFATIIACFNAWDADRTGERFFHISIWLWGVIIANIIAISTMSIAGRYVSMFLMAAGYGGFALTLVWVSNAIPRPPAKRSAAMGIVNGFGNIGNLIGSFTWKAEWGPDYHQSMFIGIASLLFSTALAFTIRTTLIRANKKLDKAELNVLDDAERQRIEDAARLEGITFEEALERKKGFRYLY